MFEVANVSGCSTEEGRIKLLEHSSVPSREKNQSSFYTL